MMSQIKFNIRKTVEAIKLILSNLEGQRGDFHKIFKILYFAERHHLAEYGREITGDKYCAMKNGPVPSTIYDLLKALQAGRNFGDTDYSNEIDVKEAFHISLINQNINFDIFSESDIECLLESIEDNKELSFGTLTNKSHDYAWKAADENNVMSIFDIAKAGGASEDVIHYISTSLETRFADFK